jgi:hypothetical protein
MRAHCFRTFAVVGITAAVVLTQASTSVAQVDEARKVNWDNTKKLYVEIVDAVGAGKRDEADKRISELKANLDLVQDKLHRVGQRLHDRDRNWQWSAKKSNTIDKLKRYRLAAGYVQVELAKAGSTANSELSAFKSEWKDFADNFDDLWREYTVHAKELQEVQRAFKEDCRECI